MSEINAINFEDDQLERVKDSGLLSIADCCQRLVDLENEASTLEDQLNHIKEEMLSIRNEKIPDIMQEKNLTQLKLNDGSAIEIRNWQFPQNCPAGQQSRPLEWYEPPTAPP